jgi:DNA-binding NarL/FixJ family response regulator/AraC-like DNA-binding protein
MHTILLVDDDEYVIDGMLRHVPWEQMGVRVAGTAADGREGLERFRELKPDFVITDIYMPEMDGFELTAAIHAIDPNVPIVFLSGYDDLSNARKAASSGVQHFLLKPPSIAEIEFVVREVLQKLGEEREREELLDRYLRQQPVMIRSMKDLFFRGLLATRYRPEELPHARIAFMELPARPEVQALTIQLVRTDDAARRDEREWQLLRFGAGNIIRELMGEGGGVPAGLSVEVVDYSDREFVAVFLGDPRLDDAHRSWIAERADEAVLSILRYMKLPVLAGIGTVHAGYDRLIDSYLESRAALEIAEMNEWNRVYAYAPPAGDETDRRLPSDTIRTLHDAIAQRRWSEAAELWKRLGWELAERGIALPVCKGVCSGVAGMLWTSALASPMQAEKPAGAQALGLAGGRDAANGAYAKDGAGPASGLEAAGSLDDLLAEIGRCGSVRALLDAMDAFVLRVTEAASGGQGSRRSRALVERVIRDYIEKRYHESLSLERIAAELYVNRNYLSQIFKREAGDPFVTYLNKYRVKKAIELLMTGKFMVYEISEKVGFQNATYFSQVFKSITGKSPSEYGR